MNQLEPISVQLKHRRKQLGLSLGDVARLAGTSVATLSRYENGWTRFETYTLRKLAAALSCDLSIELCPRIARCGRQSSRRTGASRLQRLFWDHRLTAADMKACPIWLVERVLEYGTLEDVRFLRDTMGREAFLRAAGKSTRLSPRTGSFWRQMLRMEGIPCTRTFSRDTAWNS